MAVNFGKNWRIGIISPAGPVDKDKLLSGVAGLEKLGCSVRLGDHALGKTGYLAASAAERFADFRNFYLDDEIDLILASRGGFGCAHLLPDLAELPKRPKLVAGYSDLTALLWALEKFDLATTLALPMAARYGDLDEKSLASAAAALAATPRNLGTFTELRPGAAQGLPLPGNLTVAASIVGTPYFPDCAGRILVLEDVNEPLYKIDRALTQLEQGGAFAACGGVIFGEFTQSGATDAELDELLIRATRQVAGPVLRGLRYRHEFPFESLNCRQKLEIAQGRVWAG